MLSLCKICEGNAVLIPGERCTICRLKVCRALTDELAVSLKGLLEVPDIQAWPEEERVEATRGEAALAKWEAAKQSLEL